MATGAQFEILANDGRQDRELCATELLNTRFREIQTAKGRAGMADISPTLAEISATHVFFLNAIFKPYVQTAYMYTKVNATGVVNFGKSIKFDIPNGYDFFADMAVHINLGQMTAASATGYLPDPPGAPANLNYPPCHDQVRWAELLGLRLINRAMWSVNGIPVDIYDSQAANMYYKFQLPYEKIQGFNRCIGQENPISGTFTANPGAQQSREGKVFYNGPQTYRDIQPELDLYIPLLFYFNRNPALSIPSVACPYGQRLITIDIEQFSNMAEAIAYAPGRNPSAVQPSISAELIVNNIQVSAEVHDVYIRRIGMQMVRVYRQQVDNAVRAADEIFLSSYKWPIEYIFIGAVPNENDNPHDWHKFSKLTTNNVLTPTCYISTIPFDPVIPAFVNATFQTQVAALSALSLSAHGIPIYTQWNTAFYNSYIPYKFGTAEHIVTPYDIGACLIMFSLHPGVYQPSGHINISRARELNYRYTSTVFSDVYRGKIHSIAVAINFVIISNGAYTLRYAT